MRRALPVLLALGVLVLSGCGDVEVRTFSLDVQNPSSEKGALPFHVAVVKGTAVEAKALRVKITDPDGAIYDFEAKPGTVLAFAQDEAVETAPVVLPGLESTARSPEESLAVVKARFQERKLPVTVAPKANGEAFLVTLEGDREDKLAEIVHAATGNADLRFLMEVLPASRYGTWRDGQVAPRLAEGAAPWQGSQAEFDVYKAAEVEAWRVARDAGKPYEPSSPRHFVLPRHGSAGAAPSDFAVLEWPAEPQQRFDQRMLADARTGLDERRRPAVYYGIRPAYQAAFREWTGANVGLPMAIVLNWTVRSAPTINSALSDNVQITLGRGSMREMQKEAEEISAVLGAGGPVLPTSLVAIARWGKDGAFEVQVPLPDEGELRVGVEAAHATGRSEVSVPLRYVATAPTSAKQSVIHAVAAVLLGMQTPEEAAPPLRAFPASVQELATLLAGDAPIARRVVAVDLLGRVDAESGDALDALVEALATDRAEIRLVAIAALANLEASDTQFEALSRAVGDADPHVGAAAVRSLVRVGRDRAETLDILLGSAAAEGGEARSMAQMELPRLLPEAGERLEQAAREGPLRRRGAAIRALGIGETRPSRVAFLAGLLADELPEIRAAALSSLAMQSWQHIGSTTPLEAHMEAIAACLDDEDEMVRAQAYATVARLGPAGVPLLLPRLEQGEPKDRARVALMLSGLDDPSDEVLAALKRAAEDESLHVRLAARLALSWRKDFTEFPLALARDALAEGDDEVRLLALHGLLMQVDELKDVDLPLEPLLDAETEDVRVGAAVLLERQGKASEKTQAVLAPVRADPKHRLHHLVHDPD